MTAFAFLPSMTPSMPQSLQVIERGWVSSNSVVFADGDDTAVVDTGYGRHAQQTVALVNHALAGRALKRIVNTHTHSDHIGGNAALRRAHPAVRIHILVGEAHVIHHWDEAALHLTAMGQQCERFAFDCTFGVCDGASDGISGSRGVARAEPSAADTSPDMLRLGGLDWQAIGSPGHDASSQMLYCAGHGILISADALWENGFGVIFAEVDGAPDAQGKAFAAQRATLDTIATLDVRCVIPGHGAPFTNARAALERAYSRLDFFIAHPERHARNALKVTLAFLLMIEGRVALDGLPAHLAALPLAARINVDYYQLDAAALTTFVVTELERSGAAHRTSGWLVSGKPMAAAR